jgi:hypothetical protein
VRLLLILTLSAVGLAGFAAAEAVTYEVDLAAAALGAPASRDSAPFWARGAMPDRQGPERVDLRQADSGRPLE